MPFWRNQPWFISNAKVAGLAAQWLSSVCGFMSSMLRMRPCSSRNATDSGSRVFFIHMQWRWGSVKMNNMPWLAGMLRRFISPTMRWSGVAATSASMRYMPALSSVSGIDDWAARRPRSPRRRAWQTGLGDRTKWFHGTGTAGQCTNLA
jgi:hypothetical protein